MKNLIKFSIVSIVLLVSIKSKAQVNSNTNPVFNGFRISASFAYDKPFISLPNKYVTYKVGLSPNIGLSYYWNRWGFGIDADFINNKSLNRYPTSNLLNTSNVLINNFSLLETDLRRRLLTFGPNYQIAPRKAKWSLEMQARVGVSSVKGGRVLLFDLNTPVQSNYFSGFNQKHLISSKLAMKANYLLTKRIALTAGAYYIYQHKTAEYLAPGALVTNQWENINTTTGGGNQYNGITHTSTIPGTVNLKSAGVTVGVSILFNKVKRQPKVKKNSLIITTKDKISGVTMQHVKVLIKTADGNVVQSTKTNESGRAIISDLTPEDYFIEASIAGQPFEIGNVSKNEMSSTQFTEKTIWYANTDFIIDGKILECNTNTPLPNTKVVISSDDAAINLETNSDDDGYYQHRVVTRKTYQLYGRRNNIFSQVVSVDPSMYDRKKSVFIPLEICGQVVDCNTAITLNNVLFDFAKYNLNENAKTELNKLVRFMLDNPTVKVELSSHTDSRGDAEANQILSQKRAESSKNYIESKGIGQERIIARGYGESRLLNHCDDKVKCSEQENAINRRTEIKLICE